MSQSNRLTRIDELADQFEAAWKRGEFPAIDEFLTLVPEAMRDALRNELTLIDVHHRRRRGEQSRSATGLANSDAQETRLSPTSPPEMPASIGRYATRRQLGCGAFGVVYEGWDDVLERPVAIKVPLRSLNSSSWSMATFLREARCVASLRHDGIVNVYDFGESDSGQCYIVYEFVEGTNLRQRIEQDCPLSVSEVARIIADVGEALDYASRRGLVHRDIKPENILIDKQGTAKIADFGLALREEDMSRERGRLVGTLPYMSPEQIRGEGHRLDGRTDIYSLGVVLYELLTGRRPFDGESTSQLAEQILYEVAKPPRQIVAAVSLELERICLKAIAKRVTDRYTAARDFASEIRSELASSDHTSNLVVHQQDVKTQTLHLPLGRHIGSVIPKGLRPFGVEDSGFFLDLLPGPRDRYGLPESIRFWKVRIESRADEECFAVGLLYGPSGCGKTSLLKAGLLPRLASHVSVVYLNCEAQNTESRLLAALRRVLPALDLPGNLTQAISDIRRSPEMATGNKLLIVLDQFEQWLHSQPEINPASELVGALRQCDGAKVQCLITVRDDFWLGVARLFQVLELHLIDDRNVALVDLVDTEHARNVLRAFGRAYGAAPEDSSNATQAYEEFVEQAVAALSENGKVVCAQLSLMAEMMRGRLWIPETLTSLGGLQGIGARFLDELFCSPAATPERRAAEKSVRSLLLSLLPDPGSNIKGGRRSCSQLAQACGLDSRSDQFLRTLEILDRELHLITPVDPAGDGPPEATTQNCLETEEGSAASHDPSYQLTHDYLVSLLREWLTLKRRETWRGRAQLALEEQATQWSRTDDDRFLPTLGQFLTFQLAVSPIKRTTKQRRMLTKTTRRYAKRTAVVCLIAVVLGWAAWEINGRRRADGIVQAIATSSLEQTPRWVEQLYDYQRWMADPIDKRLAEGENPEIQARRALALLPADPSQREILKGLLLDAVWDPTFTRFKVIRDALEPASEDLVAGLWQTFRGKVAPDSPGRPTESNAVTPVAADHLTADTRFRAGLALSAYDPEAKAWEPTDAEFLCRGLVAANPDYQQRLRRLLAPVSGKLLYPLHAIFRDESASAAARLAAAVALNDWARDKPELIAELISEATPEQFRVMFPAIAAADARRDVVPTLEAICRRQPGDNASETERVRLGAQRAGAAIALLRLGHPQQALSALDMREDPEAVTQFNHGLSERDVTTLQLIDLLSVARDAHDRYATLMSLGNYPRQAVPEDQREGLVAEIAAWFRNDPDSGVHAAAGWLLRAWGMNDRLAEFDPQDASIESNRQWYVQQVDDELLTFVVFWPEEFLMGSPGSHPGEQWEDGRDPDDELRHRVRITQLFAMSDREIDGALWDRFLQEGDSDASNDRELAIKFCRWLTTKAGMYENDQCYQPSVEDDAPSPWTFTIDRRGFRLPTEAEWELACRCGTSTAYSFGSDRSLLGDYGWFQGNSNARVPRQHPGGLLRPNRRGLFDMHGNLFEWVHDAYVADRSGAPVEDPVIGPSPVFPNYVARGGCWQNDSRSCRSAFRQQVPPSSDFTAMRFRVAQSIPSPPEPPESF